MDSQLSSLSDPEHFQSQYNGTKAATSRVAALKFVYHESERPSFELSPRISSSWCQPFTTLALTGKSHNPAGANFMVISRQGRIEQIEVDETDKTPADDETPISLGKRKSLNDPREGPVAKTRRSTLSQRGGSATNRTTSKSSHLIFCQ